MTDARTVARRALITVLVLAVVVPIAAVLAARTIAFGLATRPPNLVTVAHSAEVTNADRAVTALLDDRLDSVVRAAPAASVRATSVEDRCESSSAIFSRRVSCFRSVVRYLGINGALTQRQQTWDRALTAAGWLRNETTPAPAHADVSYLSATPGPPGPLQVQVWIEWTERPGMPAVNNDFDRGRHEPTFGWVNLTEQPVDKIAVYQQTYPHYQYVVAVRTVAYYYPTTPLPTPTPPPDRGPHCFGGHGDCPGG
jgi:hypothetical protein